MEENPLSEENRTSRSGCVILLVGVGLAILLSGICAMTPDGAALYDSIRKRFEISQPLVRPTSQAIDTPTATVASTPVPTLTATATATVIPSETSAPFPTSTSVSTAPIRVTPIIGLTVTPDVGLILTLTINPSLPVCECQGTDYVCPGLVTQYNSTLCGGSGLCVCRGQTLVCADGTVADFNPQCPAGGNGGSGAGCTCQNIICSPVTGVCVGVCKETGLPCR